MHQLRSFGAAAVMAALLTASGAQAFDDARYPNLKGQWVRAEGSAGVGRFDPTKPPGRLQEPPLTAEYQAIYEANLADQALGGQGIDPTYRCLSPGMPRIMHAYSPMEIVVTPETTHILIDHIHVAASTPTDATGPRIWTRTRCLPVIPSADGSTGRAPGGTTTPRV